jgi:hypothetical protein
MQYQIIFYLQQILHDGLKERYMEHCYQLVMKYEKSKYQWLPSEFNIDLKGNCKITSYINNLPEE